jgi:hypothetical protein
MKPEKQQLIHELIGGESRSESTLLAATKILRRRRQWRAAQQTFALLAVLAAAILLFEQQNHRKIAAQVSPPQAKLPSPTQVHSLSDEELLALFPNTPIALATLPNGKKLLIFPRPSDQAKYVNHL